MRWCGPGVSWARDWARYESGKSRSAWAKLCSIVCCAWPVVLLLGQQVAGREGGGAKARGKWRLCWGVVRGSDGRL